MTEQKTTGPWTLVIQGEGSFDNADEHDIEQHAEQFSKDLENRGHRIQSVRLSVGNEREYNGGEWHHAHSAAETSASSS